MGSVYCAVCGEHKGYVQFAGDGVRVRRSKTCGKPECVKAIRSESLTFKRPGTCVICGKPTPVNRSWVRSTCSDACLREVHRQTARDVLLDHDDHLKPYRPKRRSPLAKQRVAQMQAALTPEVLALTGQGLADWVRTHPDEHREHMRKGVEVRVAKQLARKRCARGHDDWRIKTRKDGSTYRMCRTCANKARRASRRVQRDTVAAN
jgi:hypothetical protein